MTDSSSLTRMINLVASDLTNIEAEDLVDDRQGRVAGFDRFTLPELTVLLVGCGGLGSWYGTGLLRKGIGKLKLLDPDEVELSNLTRQKFYRSDIHQSKAGSLAKNLLKEGTMGTRISPYDLSFQRAKEEGIDLSADLIIAGVDNNEGRIAVSKHALAEEVPAIFTGVSRDASQGYVFVQEVDGPCFGCLFPDAGDEDEGACAKTPAVLDILMLIGGYVLYAVDSLFMERERNWNYLRRSLGDQTTDTKNSTIERREDCFICGSD